MDYQALKDDIEVLAGRFGNRRGASEEERSAALYLLDRLKSCSPFAYLDDFITMESYFLLFAMYYTEFLIVALICIWSGSVATAYGVFVFVMYLIETSGGRIFSRLMPPLETQNVVAPFHVEKPERVVIVTVGYDTPIDGVLSRMLRSGYAHWIHRGLIVCMLLVIGASASTNNGVFEFSTIPWDSMVRWSAVAVLLGAALLLYVHTSLGEDVRGANNNASGVAALLAFAQQLKDEPLKSTDVWLVAVGNSYGSQDGIRRVLESIPQDKSETYVLTMQGIGGGKLHYLKGEGILHPQAYKSKLAALAKSHSARYNIDPAVYRGLPTLGFCPNLRGYNAVTVMGLSDGSEPVHAWSCEDRHTEIDTHTIRKAADFTYGLIEALDQQG